MILRTFRTVYFNFVHLFNFNAYLFKDKALPLHFSTTYPLTQYTPLGYIVVIAISRLFLKLTNF
jgi:hypothetical protein